MILQRVITAVVLLPLVILAIFKLTIEAFALVIGAIICISLWEWSGFLTKNIAYRAIYVVTSVVLMWLIQQNALPMDYWHGFASPESILEWFNPKQLIQFNLLLSAIWWLIALILLFIYPRVSQSLVKQPIIMIVIGWLMLIPTWVAVVGIRSMGISFDHNHGAELLLFVLIIIWAADTGAYFAGKTFGKHKLAAKVSPKKTWEGVFGGLALSAVVVFFGIDLLHFESEQLVPLICLTVIIVIFSVVGDLTESIFKRLTDTKDSGTLLPGHGGFLDRIDGITAALPLALLGFSLFGIK